MTMQTFHINAKGSTNLCFDEKTQRAGINPRNLALVPYWNLIKNPRWSEFFLISQLTKKQNHN